MPAAIGTQSARPYSSTYSIRDEQKLSAIDSLVYIIDVILETNSAATELKQSLRINGEAIFDSIDFYHQGKVYTGDLRWWFRDACNFEITEA